MYINNIRPHRIAWSSTPAFQAENTGSNPVGATWKKMIIWIFQKQATLKIKKEDLYIALLKLFPEF